MLTFLAYFLLSGSGERDVTSPKKWLIERQPSVLRNRFGLNPPNPSLVIFGSVLSGRQLGGDKLVVEPSKGSGGRQRSIHNTTFQATQIGCKTIGMAIGLPVAVD